MSNSYYHVTPTPQADTIEQNGLRPTDAAECPDGCGVHLTTALSAARRWAHRLRAERGDHETEYTILEVTLPAECEVVTDDYPGNGPEGAVVACTTEPLTPQRLTPVEWL